MWWTGLGVVAAVATAIVAPALIARQFVAAVTLGPEEPLGGYFYALALPTLWLGTITLIPDQYLRVRKWSVLSVCLSFAFLVLNVVLNVYFLAVMHLGVAGVLWGNLITGVLAMVSRCVILAVACRPLRFKWSLAGQLWKFGSPLVLVAIFSTIMHQADRGLLRIFVDLNQVGVYALAYTIGQFWTGPILNLMGFIATFYLTAALFVFVVLGVIAPIGGVSIVNFLAYIQDELLIVLRTSSSRVALPSLLDNL